MTMQMPSPADTFVPCATTDPEIFHDDENASVAKALCAGCPLNPACRTEARDTRSWGTWGGETTDERAAAGYQPRGWRGPRRRNKPARTAGTNHGPEADSRTGETRLT